MNWFSNLKTGRKLALGFGTCLLLALTVGAVALSRMAQMNRLEKEITEVSLTGIKTLAVADAAMRQVRILEYRHVLTDEAAAMDKIEGLMNAQQERIGAALDDYERSIVDAEDRKNLDTLKGHWERYQTLHQKVLQLGRRNDTRRGAALLNGPMADLFLGGIVKTLDAMSVEPRQSRRIAENRRLR
jgi:methyl-accepting chemotaxis protein